ncbi:hypothetical protein OsJ_27348 [Oryza sativa Japonica Group]|uniref:CCHC-type domain-containing protein n=1 Tax=Oryza sativa subsp. japonica TaxID=39947 RepID=B9G0Y3_ORYSJ|nr:hypothetical protein OsJ_27348 [Oryza sativa Japonica Group]
MAAAVTVKPLNGAEEYLRWKESMLLVLHTAGVAHVLSDEPPPPTPAAAAAGVKEEDGEAEAAAAAAQEEAVARAYDGAGALSAGVARRAFDDLEFYANAPLLEQIAHAEALNAATRLPLGDEDLAGALCEMLPESVGGPASARSGGGATMRDVWRVARLVETRRVCREDMERHGRCWRCGKPGHHTSNCMG